MLVICTQCQHFFYDQDDPESDYQARFNENDNEVCPFCQEEGCLMDLPTHEDQALKHQGMEIIRSAILNEDEPTFTIRASDPCALSTLDAYLDKAGSKAFSEKTYLEEAQRSKAAFLLWQNAIHNKARSQYDRNGQAQYLYWDQSSSS